MSEDDEEDLFLSKKEFALFIDYRIVSEEAATRWLAIQESQNPDRRIQGIFFPTILPISPPKNIDLNELQWMKHQSSSPPAWSSQHHSAYTFAKIFVPDITNKHRHTYSKSWHIFPAHDLDFKGTIEIRNHIKLQKLDGRNKDQIIKIAETRSRFYSQDQTSTCVYIHQRTLKKLLITCIWALNLVLIPIVD